MSDTAPARWWAVAPDPERTTWRLPGSALWEDCALWVERTGELALVEAVQGEVVTVRRAALGSSESPVLHGDWVCLVGWREPDVVTRSGLHPAWLAPEVKAGA